MPLVEVVHARAPDGVDLIPRALHGRFARSGGVIDAPEVGRRRAAHRAQKTGDALEPTATNRARLATIDVVPRAAPVARYHLSPSVPFGRLDVALLALGAGHVLAIFGVRVFVRQEKPFVGVEEVVADVRVGVMLVVVVQGLEHVGHLDALLRARAVAETAAVADFLVQGEAVHRAAAASEGVVEEVPHNLPVVAAAVVETKKVEHEILGGALRQRRALPIRREGGAHERLGLG